MTSTLSFSQKRERISGNKIVTVEQKEIKPFENLEIEDNLEVFLVKGEKNALEIDADENLHGVINISSNGNNLRLTTAKEVTSFKKFSVKITYTNDFKMLIAKHESKINTISDLDLENFTFKCYDYCKLFSNAKVKKFTLMTNDKSKVELNLKSEEAVIEINKNSQVKALIGSNKLKIDMYQKAMADIEGDVNEMKLRIDNNSEFMGKNLIAKNSEIITEGYTKCSINVVTNAIIEASGRSEIQFYGDAKIELRKFTENTVIMKKSLAK